MTTESTLPPARTIAQRKSDTLARLATDIDLWVASADLDGRAHLIPLSFYWDGRRVVLATWGNSVTARNLARAGWARVALGTTRDVVILEGPLEVVPIGDDKELADAYAVGAGWDPRDAPGSYVLITVVPEHIQAWREANENIQDRDIMIGGQWLA